MPWLLKAVWWGAKFVAKTFLWVAAKPVLAAVVGVGLVGAAALLQGQPWAGADVLSRMLGYAGVAVLTGGIGAWIGGKVLSATIGRAAGRFIGEAVAFGWMPPRGYWSVFGWAP